MGKSEALGNSYKKKLDDLIYTARHNLSTKKVDVNLISNAFRFSLEAHKNDKRASGEPYFIHPYEVAKIMAKEIPVDDICITAALLHDVVEDTKFTLEDIKSEFGNEVAEIVDGASKIEGIFENYSVKAVDSYKKLLLSMASDIRIILIKFADRLHNLRTLEFLSESRQVRIARETLEFFAPFAHRFGLSNIKSEMEDLSFKYLDRATYDDLANKVSEKKRERDKFIRKFIEPIKESLNSENYKYEISGRSKHIYSIFKKLDRVKSFDEIYDLMAVRIILDTENSYDCFAVYGLVSKIYMPVPERFKDYISLPKQNGYQSIHTSVVSKEGKIVEVQIRTREMHEVAEKGIAAHYKYKEKSESNDKKLDSWMIWIREAIENAGKDEVSSSQLFESFKLNLYQDEIYCFTPKGELKILPYGATPVDFAFEIHTQVGMHCIGAKANGKIVSLDTPLKSGSQVEIITSKNQSPKRDWEKFVITTKARSDIKKYFNIEKRKTALKGKEILEKKFKKHKIHINSDELTKLSHSLKYKDLLDLQYEVGLNESKADEISDIILNKTKSETEIPHSVSEQADAVNSEISFEKFVKQARSATAGIIIGRDDNKSTIKGLKYDYAKCCSPIPGDDVIGYITQTEGFKIHRKNCNNIVNLYLSDPDRVMEVSWGDTTDGEFSGGIKIIGEDKPGMLNELTDMMLKNFKVNIKSVNIFSKGSMFEGTFIVSVESLKQLNAIIEKVNNQEGIIAAQRFVG